MSREYTMSYISNTLNVKKTTSNQSPYFKDFYIFEKVAEMSLFSTTRIW